MKLPSRTELEDFAATLRKPRVIMNGAGTQPYLSRYYLHGLPTMPDGSDPFDANGDERDGAIWNKSIGVYLHRFHMSDEDRELHNHPWEWSFSIILVGGYREERRIEAVDWEETLSYYTTEERFFKTGDVNFIGRNDFHRVDLLDGECWTLFVAGPKIELWGFWERTSGLYFPWREFISRKRGLSVARED